MNKNVIASKVMFALPWFCLFIYMVIEHGFWHALGVSFITLFILTFFFGCMMAGVYLANKGETDMLPLHCRRSSKLKEQ